MRSLNLLLSAFFLGTGLVGSAQCGLFFSEYSESNGGNTKYLEIYNPTNAPVSLAGHAIAATANAPSTPGVHEFWNQLDETAVIAPGDVYVWANSGSEATVLVETDQTGNAYFNGDDSYALVSGTEDSYEFIDIIGNFDGDPGSGWAVAGVANATKDHTLVRKGSVTQGVGYDWAASAGTDADDSQWIVYDQNTWDYVGSHEFTGSCGAAVPGCTNENATNYNVDATEDDGSCTFDNACNEDGVVVTTASLYYSPQNLAIEPGTMVIWENIGGNHNANGTTDSQTGESFGNPEDFFFAPVSSSGEAVCIGSFTFTIPGVYAYDCSVGSHAAAGMVGTVTVGTGGCMNPAAPNYNESADYDDGSCLEVQTTSIATIQEGQLTDAYTGTTVVTNGVVTGVFGSLVSLQDGQGPYSGIWMYNPNVNVVVGDDIEVTGTVSEYNGLTQLSSPSIVINAQGAELPTPEVLSTGTAASDEQWEGVLVQVTGDVSSESLGYGEWGLDDTSGECRVDDRGYDVIDETGNVTAGSTWQVTGPLDYSFGNYKIQPRSEADALLYGCTDMSAANYNPGAGIDDGTCESSGQTCGLFFSECAEGSSNNKYLEIYNPTSAAVFLGQYILGNQSNGTSDGSVEVEYWTDFPFTASISPGGTFIVAHPSADSLILANADMTHTYLSNGDDAYGLYSMVSGDTVLIDIIGAYGLDPGSGWDVAGVTNATANHTLVRNEFVYAGNGGDWAMSAGTNALDSEWMVLDNNDWSDLGSHTFSETCISVTAGCLDSFAINYDPTMLTDDGSCFYPAAVTIQEIQEGGLTGPIQTSGVVTAVYESFSELANEATFVIQDGVGPYSAIWVVGTGVQEGDEVTVTGTASDWYGLQWISPASYTVQSSGNALPAAEVLGTDAINHEQWEAVLVEMSGTCIENGVDQAVDDYGQWKLDDGSGSGMVSRIGYDAGADSITNGAGQTTATVELGAKYKVTGPNMHSYSNWKLAPRTSTDVVRIGCTDPTFSNYDAFAQEDDGTCVNAEGCTNPNADNYDAAATIDDGTCIVSGCDDPAAYNYQEGVNNPTNEDCYYTLPNIVINEIHYNPCTDQGDDFDYEFVELVNIGDSPVDLEGLEFYNTSGVSSPQLGLTFGAGATAAPGEYLLLTISDESTANYSGLGAQVFQMTEGNFSNSGEAVSLEDGFGNVINAVTYDVASPWPAQTVAVLGNVLVQSPDGGCSSLELIETDLNNDNPSNWQASWVDNGTPGAPNSSAFGCVDAAACNFASGAFFDDGSCTYDCYGCTYDGASNYDATATMENGTCEFDFTDPCPADVNEDGQVGTPDLLFFLSQFGTMCPE